MKLPNKFITYKESIISKFPLVLNNLQESDLSIGDLYKKVRKEISGVQEFLDILDCLYVLNKITLVEEVVHYVKAN
ncbi:MAG: hypothetical protein MR775_01785 [Erysipelotrichaceae bacterium]|nr:hypothetical protein [Erysipelotrichaceae bacterium]